MGPGARPRLTGGGDGQPAPPNSVLRGARGRPMSGPLGGAGPAAAGRGGARRGGARARRRRGEPLPRPSGASDRGGAGRARGAAAGLQQKTMAAPAGAGAVTAAPGRRRCLWSVLAAALGLRECGGPGGALGRGGSGRARPSWGSGPCAPAPRRGPGAACALGAGDPGGAQRGPRPAAAREVRRLALGLPVPARRGAGSLPAGSRGPWGAALLCAPAGSPAVPARGRAPGPPGTRGRNPGSASCTFGKWQVFHQWGLCCWFLFMFCFAV